MNRGAAMATLVALALAAVFFLAPAALAEEGLGLSDNDMLDHDRVIIYLDHAPDKVRYLPEPYAVALLEYVKQEKAYAFGGDLWLLDRVEFTLNMYLLDVRLSKMLHSKTLAPEGYVHESKPHQDKGDKDGAYVNTAKVTARGPLDVVVYDDDDAKVKPMHPSIEIEKTPNKQQVVAGKAVFFQVIVTNTGDVPLRAVRVMDPQVPDCERTIGALDPGEKAMYKCEAIATGDFNNVATVTAYDPNGGAVVDSDDAYVDAINPSIKIEKTPDLQRVVAGKPVTFTITVTNTGDVPLHDLEISDSEAPDCQRVIDHLGVLESISYDCVVVVGQADGAYANQHEKSSGKKGYEKGHDKSKYDELLLSETYASWLGCQLHQDLASVDAKGTGLYVSPCEKNDDGNWTFQVWKAS